MTMKKYSAIGCYYGKWPSHFGMWLTSCGYNPGITFFLVTDISVEEYEVPANVCIVKMSFAEIQSLVRENFPNIEISLHRPYKLCDFRTAYGQIFKHLIKDYEYWGYYDFDTIWGDIEKFIPENEDNHLVKIFPCGHLSFIRNAAPWDRVYEMVNQVSGTPCRNNMQGKQVATWQDCFSSPMSHYYDEEGGLEPLLSYLAVPQYGSVDFDNVLPPWRFDHFVSINFPEKSNYLIFSFEEGKVFRHYIKGLKLFKEEISYLHLSRRSLGIFVPSSETKFIIYPNKIVPYTGISFIYALIHGRYRYVSNILRRLKNRLNHD